MSIARTQYLTPVVLPAGKVRAGIEASMEVGGAPPEPTVSLVRILPDHSRDEQNVPVRSLDAVCDLGEEGLHIQSGWNRDGEFHYVAVSGGKPRASVYGSSPSAGVTQELIDAFIRGSGVSPWTEAPTIDPSPSPEGQDVLADVGSLRDDPSHIPAHIRLRAFLTYRFTSGSHELEASRLAQLLAILDVDTVTGSSYEPRRISDKVKDRLIGIDLVVPIIHADGESMWTRDEILTAHTAGAFVMPIVEEGAEFASGLLGDVEYVTFSPGHIGDAFLSVAQAVEYVRRVKSGRG